MVKGDKKAPSRIFVPLVFQVCINGTCHPHSVLKYDCNAQEKCNGHGVSASGAAESVLVVWWKLLRTEQFWQDPTGARLWTTRPVIWGNACSLESSRSNASSWEQLREISQVTCYSK